MPESCLLRTVLRIPVSSNHRKHGFTIVEVLVVISIIAILAAFLMVAAQGGRDAAGIAKTRVKLKQVGEWMQLWSGSNDNRILPSQFDFIDEAEAGASVSPRRDIHASDDNMFDDMTRGQYQGTWADILWTENSLHQTFGLLDRDEFDEAHLLWESDSPDNTIYDVYETFDHPFRSMFVNSRGPAEDLPGYFAANDFFDARSDDDADGDTTSKIDRYYTYAMINSPGSSVYLVDSVAGETISDEPEPWLYDFATEADGQIIDPTTDPQGEIDYRYGGQCMLLLLDNSIKSVPTWAERGPEDPLNGIDNSLYGIGYRVHDLTKRVPTP